MSKKTIPVQTKEDAFPGVPVISLLASTIFIGACLWALHAVLFDTCDQCKHVTRETRAVRFEKWARAIELKTLHETKNFCTQCDPGFDLCIEDGLNVSYFKVNQRVAVQSNGKPFPPKTVTVKELVPCGREHNPKCEQAHWPDTIMMSTNITALDAKVATLTNRIYLPLSYAITNRIADQH
jgi:hypothetical protein